MITPCNDELNIHAVLEFSGGNVSAVRVHHVSQRTEHHELAGLYFLQSMATAMWFVPLGNVLTAAGMQQIVPYAFATTAAAALISPLLFGALADRHVSPARVLRWLAVATCACMVVVMVGIQRRLNPWLILALIQVQALLSIPTASVTVAIIFARLQNANVEFGPVRVWATYGWMCGCWTVSALGADASVRSGYADAFIWLGVAGATLLLPDVPPLKSLERPTLVQRMGWDAVSLLKVHDHRVVIVTAGLLYIPLAAFYPFTPRQLTSLGFHHTTAWMTLGQVTEIIAMFSLGAIVARWRLKWIFALGLSCAVLRFALCALNVPIAVLAGITVHGLSFVFVLVMAQVYVDQRVDPSWRVRAQALIYLMTSGVGNFLGFLGTGWWLAACTAAGGTRWPLFWSAISASAGLVLIYFLGAYHGVGGRRSDDESGPRIPAANPVSDPG